MKTMLVLVMMVVVMMMMMMMIKRPILLDTLCIVFLIIGLYYVIVQFKTTVMKTLMELVMMMMIIMTMMTKRPILLDTRDDKKTHLTGHPIYSPSYYWTSLCNIVV